MSGIGLAIGAGANVAIGAGALAGGKWLAENWGKEEENAARQAGRRQGVRLGEAEQILADATGQAVGGLNPYQQAGDAALQQQQALSGALGPEAQAAAYEAIAQSQGFQALEQQGQEAILANASATGGLRGGNTQAALAQFSPALLQQFIQQQYGMLGGLSGMGLSAAGQAGSFGLQGAGAQAGYRGERGAVEAGSILGQQQARTQARQQLINYGLQGAGLVGSLATGMPMGGGGGAAPAQAMPPGQPTWSY